VKRILIIATATAAVLGGGIYGAFAFFAGGGPSPLSLSTADPAPAPDGSLDGEWNVLPADSFLGYRIREKLTFLPAPSDAVGRTSGVTGTMKIAGLSVTEVSVRADLSQLASDKAMRDRRIRELGLETDQFPDGTFVLETPITFMERPGAARRVSQTASGKLTLHGVTRNVRVPVRAQWSGRRIEVIGSLSINFADYDIEAIRLAQVTTEDHGTMEFKLVFVPA
jgi:polyisoprenoid-binding protein YceI